MKIVIDTTMERHMLKANSNDAMALTELIMEKYAEKIPFLTLWDEKENKTVTLRKSEIMAIFVYPDELCDYDKTAYRAVFGEDRSGFGQYPEGAGACRD